MRKKFERFAKGQFVLEIRRRGRIVFRSKKEGLGGLLVFVKKHGRKENGLVIFDKVVGRAAALLFAYLGAKEVYGVVGSRSGEKVLRQFKIQFYFEKTVSQILNKAKNGLCPMEKLSRAKTPGELYRLLRA